MTSNSGCDFHSGQVSPGLQTLCTDYYSPKLQGCTWCCYFINLSAWESTWPYDCNYNPVWTTFQNDMNFSIFFISLVYHLRDPAWVPSLNFHCVCTQAHNSHHHHFSLLTLLLSRIHWKENIFTKRGLKQEEVVLNSLVLLTAKELDLLTAVSGGSFFSVWKWCLCHNYFACFMPCFKLYGLLQSGRSVFCGSIENQMVICSRFSINPCWKNK